MSEYQAYTLEVYQHFTLKIIERNQYGCRQQHVDCMFMSSLQSYLVHLFYFAQKFILPNR